MVPEMMPVAIGTAMLGLGAGWSAAGDRLPQRRRPFVVGIALILGFAGAAFTLLLARRWAEIGWLPLHSHFEAWLQALAGLVLGAAVLAVSGPVALRAAAGACVVGVAMGLLALRDDPEPLNSTPAVQAFPAFVHYTLKWTSFGLMLAATGGAGARLLDSRTGEGVPEAWDRALHRLVKVGLPLLMVSFLVGAFWHGAAWASPISWDPVETWHLATLLVFVGWLHLRQVVPPTSRAPSFVLLLGGLLTLGWWTFLRFAPETVNSLEFGN